GLQNRWRRARRGAVGSTPMRSRHARSGGPMASPTDAPRPPSVERLLAVVRPRLAGPARATKGPAHRSNLAAAREILADERARIERGEAGRDLEALAAELTGRLEAAHEPVLAAVINATGVIVHTNLGRAPWPAAAVAAAAA